MYVGYTDGSCEPNPGSGGWAYIVIDQQGNIIDRKSSSEQNTTNNRMEYMAMVELLSRYKNNLSAAYTDSMMLVDTCNSWRFRWKQNNWTRSNTNGRMKPKKQKEVKNLDLVLKLDELLGDDRQLVKWVKGHNGNKFNEICDSMANEQSLALAKNINPNYVSRFKFAFPRANNHT